MWIRKEEIMSRWKSIRLEPIGTTLEEEFEALMTWMNRDTGHSSRIKDSIEHPAFAEIVKYGQKMLPFILKRELCWVEFELLYKIIGSRPEIPEEHRGRLGAMRTIYLDWLEKKGYIHEQRKRRLWASLVGMARRILHVLWK
jgi:hypothetical protein